MAFPKTFSIDFRSGNPAVFEITAGLTPVQRGSDLPGATSVNPSVTSNLFKSEGMVTNYKGQTYCLYRNEVFRYRPGSFDDWESVYSDTVQTTDQGLRMTRMLLFSTLDGDTAMGFCYNDSAGRTHSAYTTTGDSGDWTVFDYGGVGDGARLNSLIFENKFVWHDTAQNGVIFVDPINETRVEINYSGLSSSAEGWNQLFIFEDDLYLLGFDSVSPNGIVLQVFNGAAFVELGDVENTSGRWNTILGGVATGHAAVWTDSATSTIHLITNGAAADTTYGSSYFTITLGGTNPVNVTEYSDPVIPASLRSGRAGTSNQRDRWFTYVDNDSDPANPIIYLLVLQEADLANNWVVYQYVDTSTELTSLGTWAAGTYGPPEATYGGNRNLVTDVNSAYATIVGTAAANGGFEISYEVAGSLGTGDATIKLYYDITQGAQPWVQATLTGTPTGGGTRVGNEIQGVVPDYGATTHTMIWNIFADGVDEDDPVRVMIDAT